MLTRAVHTLPVQRAVAMGERGTATRRFYARELAQPQGAEDVRRRRERMEPAREIRLVEIHERCRTRRVTGREEPTGHRQPVHTTTKGWVLPEPPLPRLVRVLTLERA